MVKVEINFDTPRLQSEAMKILKAWALELKGRSQQECPVDQGTLRDSCVVEETSDSVTVGYGGAASSYAAEQHENLHYHHTIGKAKFLEDPFNEMLPELLKRLEEASK